jgi:transglutaminase-like putative cysteine protease
LFFMTTAQKRPQLTVEELQQLKWLIGGVLTLLGVSTVIYMDVDAWTLMVLTGLVTLASLIRPTLPSRVHPLVHTLAFPAIVAFFVADLWFKTEILPAMVRLDILLLLYRNVSYRQRRDDLQIIVLGLFLIVVAGVLTVSLVFAAQLLVYTGCALALLLVVTLSDAVLTPAAPTPVPYGEVPGWAQHTHWRQLFRRLREVTDWRVLGLGLVLFAGVVGVSALLFLAIPRFQFENSMLLDRFITKKAKSGFSDTIRIGEVTEIQQDNSLALSVDVSDQSQIPAAPYWRMLVLDSYENGSFRFSPALRRLELGEERSIAELRGYSRPRLGESVHWTFYLESGVSRYLPLMGHFETLRFRETQNFRFAPWLGIVALREDPVTMTAYRVDGFDLSPSLPDPTFAKEWRVHVRDPQPRVTLQLRLPIFRSDSDVATLQRAIEEVAGGTALSAAEFSRRASEWLRRNHNYSLSPNIPSGTGDPLIRWLGSRGAGHCELFAGSFVLLARTAGFPARVITGFRGGSWNGFSNNFTIRNADAHAWAEIFDAQTGAWLRADPLAIATTTAVEEVRGQAAVASRLDRSWKARLDSLRVFWYRRIVSFDQRSQVETLKAVKEATQNSGKRLREALRDAMARLKAWLMAPWDFRRVVVTLVGVGVIGAGFWLWREFGRDWWRRLGRGRGNRREDPIRRDAGRWLKQLKPDETTDLIAQQTVRDLERLRFGARATWPDPQRVFRQARRLVRGTRRRSRSTPT